MKFNIRIFAMTALGLFLVSASTASLIQNNERAFDLYCYREAVVEIEQKATGQKAQVEKEPKITIGTRVLSTSRSYIDAEVFWGDRKAYRFTVDKRTVKIDHTEKLKKIFYECSGIRYDLDGSVHPFCGPWIEVFEKGPYGTESFLGYEENGILEPNNEIRSRSEFPDGRIIESLVNNKPRVTYETEAEIWRIFREHQNCLMTPQI